MVSAAWNNAAHLRQSGNVRWEFICLCLISIFRFIHFRFVCEFTFKCVLSSTFLNHANRIMIGTSGIVIVEKLTLNQKHCFDINFSYKLYHYSYYKIALFTGIWNQIAF